MEDSRKSLQKVDIAIARGDGIGPEIMSAVLHILDAAGAELNFHEIEVGEKVYLKGFSTGIEPQSWDVIRSTKAFLKAPITTPQGGGYRSLNVTIRTTLGLYANIRPCVAYYPIVKTKHPGMDVVIIRENEEDLYTGIEYRPTKECYHALKVITQEGCEKIIRFAFEYALKNGRKKVTCFTKDNILKLSDGLFHRAYQEIAKEYPQITSEHWIVDIGAAKLADTPEAFDVIVLPNLYGDILSDVAAQIAGSVGLAGSANIGTGGAMFEAIHGSAPRRAGQNLANPSGLLLAAVMMLEHIGKQKSAALIYNGWLKTLEEGIHTYDIFKEGISQQKVGTKEFADAVVQRLGKTPEILKPKIVKEPSAEQKTERSFPKTTLSSPSTHKKLIGVDFFIDSRKLPNELQNLFNEVLKHYPSLHFTMLTNRGLVVFPHGPDHADFSDHWRARILAKRETQGEIFTFLDLQKKLIEAGLDITSQLNLYTYDDVPGYSLSPQEQ